MSKVFLFLLILLIFSMDSLAQYDFKRGFIVMGGDSIYGYIDNANPGTSSNYCFFKSDSNAATITYTPNEIQAYGMSNSKLYVKKTVIIDESAQTIFLEYLMDGIVDLYFCRRANIDYFFIEKDSNIYALTNEKIEFMREGKNVVKDSKKYLGILTWLMSDAEELKPEISSARLEINSLINLSKDYHNSVCADKECIVYYKKQKRAVDSKWHVNAGFKIDYVMSWMNMNVSMGSVSYLYAQGEVQKWIPSSIVRETNGQSESLLKGVAPGVYLNASRNSRFSFQAGLSLQFSKSSKVKMEVLQIPLYMTYDFLRYTKIVPYMIFGISNEFYISFKAVDPLYVDYDRLTDVHFDYASQDFHTSYTQETYLYDENKVMPSGYYPVFKIGTGVSYIFKDYKKIKFECIGSYHQIKNEPIGIVTSKYEFTTIMFSVKYDFGL